MLKGPLLGIDYGLERTGLALTDRDLTLAFPLCVLHLENFGKRSRLLDELAKLALEHECQGIVIGLPLNVDGSENSMCDIMRNAAKRITRRVNLPLYFMPETLSSEEARNNLFESGLNGERLKKALDMEAARIILQSFIEMQKSGSEK